MDLVFAYGSLALGYLGWLIMMAGIASVQVRCGADSLDLGGEAGYLGPAPCSTIFGYTWWIVWFQLAVLVALNYGFVAGMDRWKTALMGYLTVLTVLTMDTANTYLYYNNIPVHNHSTTRAVVAGAVIASIANMVLMLCTCMYEEKEMIGPQPIAPPKPSIPSAVI